MSRFQQGPKSEWEAEALKILNGQIAITDDDIPALLSWLQDMNWPGSRQVVEILCSYPGDLVGPVREVLSSGDDLWRYWLLLELGPCLDDVFWHPLKQELAEIAQEFDEEGAHVQALMILMSKKILAVEQIERLLEAHRTGHPEFAGDYHELEVLILNENRRPGETDGN